jgi:P27 family predicted phage terminase small subunit
MTGGPKPKPTALRLLHGHANRGGGRKPNPQEPIPPGALSEPPEWMTPEQKANWAYAIDNAPLGLLRRLDRGMLTVWIVAEDAHRRAAQLLQTTQTLLMRQEGVPMPFPSLYLGIMNRQAAVMLRAAAELGFSPSARVRVYAPQGNIAPPPSIESKRGPKGKADRQRAIEAATDVISLEDYISRAPPRPRMG